MIVASAVYRLALSLWVGGMALFSFVVTPIIFRTFGRDAAGKIVGPIFPVYFRYVLVLASVALFARIAAGEAFHGAHRWAGTLLIATAVLFTGYQAFGLVPRMEEVRHSVASFEIAPPDDPARKEFSRLHGISMGVNLLVLLEGAVLVVAYEAFRR
ncbi:MAG: DUF4149 domain-containing protein [Desulfobacteria bacterium]